MELDRVVVRSVFAFVVLLALLRASGKRTVAEGTAFDFVFALILGDMIDDLLWGEVPASQFVVALGALAFSHTLVAWLSSKSAAFERVANGTATLLVEAGLFLRTSMRREMVSEDHLRSMLRTQGLPEDSLADVQAAHLETGGALSVSLRQRSRPLQKADVHDGAKP